VTTDVNPFQNDVAFAVVLQTDGKIIAVGNTQAGVAVIRYNANGMLDTTFGSGGITVTSLPSAGAGAFAAALQADGKLLVAGRSSPSSGSSSFLLLRYHTNSNGITGTPGTLDTAGFGAGLGYVTTAIPPGAGSGAQAVAVSLTNIVVAGFSMIGGKFAIALAQYTSTGALDATFGSGGIVTTQIIGSVDTDAAALVVQPADSKIVVAGLAGNAATQMWKVALLRYNANGTPDPTFGSGTGFVTNNISSSSTYANAVALQSSDGKIVVAGNAFADPFGTGTSDIAVLRYKTDGTLDTTGFGNPNGYVTTNVGAFDNGSAVAVQPDGKIVVAGNADAGVADRLVLIRYKSDGSDLDSGFGTAGIVTRDASGPGTIAGAQGVVLQPQPGGEIVVVGYD